MAEDTSDPTSPGLVQSLDTELYADSVEWSPLEGCQDIMLCGTYQLEDQDKETSDSETSAREVNQPQSRIGQLRVYRLESKRTDDPPYSMSLHHNISMPGILDIKWSVQRCSALPTLGLVNAAGQLQVWQIPDSSLVSPPRHLTQTDLGVSCLGLSLDWAENSLTGSTQIVASDSTGALSVFDLNGDVTQVSTWHSHDYEAWISAYDRWSPGIIYSGGDDCLFKGWDLRVGTTPIFTNKRHAMGVCSIQSNSQQEYKLAVGSYDEELHVWDTRQMKRPLAVVNLGGGIWRVKWDPFKGDKILTATMYNGFHIVDASYIDDGKMSVLAHYDCCKYLGYGADWCHFLHDVRKADETEGTLPTYIIGTASFYNHSLQIRSWPT